MRALKMIFAFISASILVTVCVFASKYDEPIMLSVPSCGIDVECEFVANGHNLQPVIDNQNVAAWYSPYIFDHAGQDFYGLWDMSVGDEVIFGDARYTCSFITTGYSCDGITTKDGERPPKADMYLCTCVPGGEQYEIYIIGIDKER